MPRFAALLRGIAPSGTNMTNDRLRAVLASLGFDDVASVLSSGNIVFRSSVTDEALLEQRIEDALALELEISSRTLVRSHSVLRALVDSHPFAGEAHTPTTYLTATFIKDPRPCDVVGDQLDPGTTVIGYDRAAGAVLAITDNTQPQRARRFLLSLEASYGTGITTRSWLSVQRIVRKLEMVGSG